jgi:putative ABC transport system permease protein
LGATPTSAWSMAIRSLRRRRLRTGLTVSGIVVGVTMTFVLLSLVAGVQNQTTQMVRALGGADITVYNSTTSTRGRFGQFGQPGFSSTISPTLNESLTQSISQIVGVYAVSPQLSFSGYVNGTRVTAYGIDPVTYTNVTGGLNIVNGTSISDSGKHEAVLGKTVASSLNATIGETVMIGLNSSHEESFTVVGIFETGISYLELAAYIPLSDAQNITSEQGFVTQILVKCVDPNDVTSVSNAITASIPGVSTTSPAALVSQASNILNTLALFFAVIGLVALFAGSFGVVNTMIMSVSERTREIGTLKAIGARDSKIMKIFLTEALLIGIIGGGVGVIVGVVLSYVFPLFTRGVLGAGQGAGFGRLSNVSISPAITSFNIILCFSLGALVGVLAGLYPAWRAARMKPVEALRHV